MERWKEMVGRREELCAVLSDVQGTGGTLKNRGDSNSKEAENVGQEAK